MTNARTSTEHAPTSTGVGLNLDVAANPVFLTDILERLPSALVFGRRVHQPGLAVDFVILYANPAFRQLSGLEPATGDLVSKLFPDIRSSDPWLVQLLERVATTGVAEETKAFFTPLKRSFSVRVYAAQKDRLVGIISAANDHQETEELLRKLSTSVQQSPTSVVITDLDGNIEYVNPRFTEVTGYSFAEVIGKNPRMLQSSLTPKATYLDMWDKLTSGRIWHGELINKRKNGDIYWESSQIGQVKNAAGKVTHYVASKTDITARKRAENILKDTEVFKQGILDSMVSQIAVLDQNGVIVAVNAPWRRFALENGLPRDKLESNAGVGANYFDVCRGDIGEDAQDVLQAVTGIRAVLAGTLQTFSLEYPCHSPAQERWFRMMVTPLGKEPSGRVVVTHTDISERKRSEALLRENAAVLRNILETTTDGYWQADGAGRLIDVNATYCQQSGYSREELLTKRITDLSAMDDSIRFSQRSRRISQTGRELFESVHRRKDGSLWSVEVSAIYRNITGGQFFVFLRDITQRKQMEMKIREMAFQDTLTQLPNRRLLLDRLSQSISTSKRDGHHGAMMFLDLDNFKELNDKYGHEAGDLLLIEVANRLTDCVRGIDTVARFGGDEFAVLLSELLTNRDDSAVQAGIIAEKIRKRLAEPYDLILKHPERSDHCVRHCCTASIGVVVFKDGDASPDDLIQRADTAMYQAKLAGRNAVRFSGVQN